MSISDNTESQTLEFSLIDMKHVLKSCAAHIINRITGCDVFEYDFEARQVGTKWLEHPLDKNGFAVEQINIGIGDFAMHQEKQGLEIVAPNQFHQFSRFPSQLKVD